MTLSERYTIFRYRLWRARRKLPLVLIPAGWIALWIAVPFSVYDGIVYAALCIACSLWGFLIRARALGTSAPLARKNAETAENGPAVFPTEGIYARMRYPLYTGNFLVWFGFILFVGVNWFIVAATAAYVACYLIVLSREGELMLHKYGEDFRIWCKQTPALIPNRRGKRYRTRKFSFLAILRGDFRNFWGMALLFLLTAILKRRMITFSWNDSWQIALAAAAALLLFLVGSLIRRKKF